MGDLWNGPLRAGSRGGKDKFKWDQIKDQSDREAYLGHSVMAPLGRWQKGRDLTWYAKEKKTDVAETGAKGGKQIINTLEQQMAEERESFRQREEDMRLEALGLKKRVNRLRGEMSETDKKNLLMRNTGDAHENDDKLGHIGRVEGLGAAPVRKHHDLSDQLRIAEEAASRGDIEGIVNAGTVIVAAPERLPGIGAQLPPGFQSSSNHRTLAIMNSKQKKHALKRFKLLQKLAGKQQKLNEVLRNIAQIMEEKSQNVEKSEVKVKREQSPARIRDRGSYKSVKRERSPSSSSSSSSRSRSRS